MNYYIKRHNKMVMNLFPTNLINLVKDRSNSIKGNINIEEKIQGVEYGGVLEGEVRNKEGNEEMPSKNEAHSKYGVVIRDNRYGKLTEYAFSQTNNDGIYDKRDEDISKQRDLRLNLPELPEEFKKYEQFTTTRINIYSPRRADKNRTPNLFDFTHKNLTHEYQSVYEGIKDYLKEELGSKPLNRINNRNDKIGSLENIIKTEIGDGSIIFENGEKYGDGIKDSEELIEVYKKFKESEFAEAAVKYGLKEIPEYDGYASIDLGENVLAAVIRYGDKEVLAVNKKYQEDILKNPELYNRVFVHEAIHRLGDKSEHSTRLKEQKIYDRIANDTEIEEVEKMLGERYSNHVGIELQNPKSYELN